MEDFFIKVNALITTPSKEEMAKLFEEDGMKLLEDRLKIECHEPPTFGLILSTPK